MKNTLSIMMILMLSMFLVGCDKNIEFVNTPDSNTTDSGNTAPIANAGEDQTVAEFETITMSGTVIVGDGEIVGYEWRDNSQLISGRKSFPYVISGEGNHTLTFTVVDENDNIGSDSVIITVTPR